MYQLKKRYKGRWNELPAHFEVDELRNRLRKRQKILTKQVEIERKKVEPTLIANPDRADMAYEYEYRGRQKSVLDRLEGQLVDVSEALERIENGTYGVCANCGKPIQAERIEALPSAEFCIECQRKEGSG